MPDLIGIIIDNRYRILEKLGQGGMAIVYKAYDNRLSRFVALKILNKDQLSANELQEYLARFKREVSLLAELQHHNIIPIWDSGEHDGAPIIIMEYMPNDTLQKSMGQPIPWQEAATVLLPVMRALASAHAGNVVHRDIKPSNILIRATKEPVLGDFGIAKSIAETKGTFKTKSGLIIGTPEYMAPEQGQGLDVDARADIYSTGVVLYELITGHKPFEATTGNSLQVLFDKLNKTVPNPRKYVPEIPAKFVKILRKALAKEPNNRYQTMNAFILEVEKELTGQYDSPLNVIRRKTRKRTAIEIALINKRTNIIVAIIALIGVITTAVLSPSLISYINSLENTPTPTLQTIIFTNAPSETSTVLSTETPPLESTKRPTPSTPYASIMVLPPKTTMHLISAGDFILGNNNGGLDENPSRIVFLDDFYIDEHEVTNSEYKICVEAGICKPPAERYSSTRPNYYSEPKFGNFPVIFVDWNMANTYCEWRGEHLPTEAQWEKAARGINSLTYPWGKELDCNHANYGKSASACKDDTTAVGSYKDGQSPYGIYDMAGNVSEWVADWYDFDYYSALTENFINPLGPDTGIVRIVRGGSWSIKDNDVRTTNRNGFSPLTATDFIGFRCIFIP